MLDGLQLIFSLKIFFFAQYIAAISSPSRDTLLNIEHNSWFILVCPLVSSKAVTKDFPWGVV